MEAAIITTYRCQNRCFMCNIWQHQTTVPEEFSPAILEKLPRLRFANVTGGEPFLREDLDQIVGILVKKAARVVISTSGYFPERAIRLAKQFPEVGFRISLEGLPKANDELRGLPDVFDHGLRTLLELKRLGIKDIGFGITVSDRNHADMLELYQLAKTMGVEFATAAVHNSYYFHKHDNRISKVEEVCASFEQLIRELLETNRPKNWFRAYFNHGLIHYVQGKPRLLPCTAGEEMFFLDPFGEVRPCNGLDSEKESMGNLGTQTFEEIWNGDRGKAFRQAVSRCPKNCWMIGTAAPAMKKNLLRPSLWVLENKLRLLAGKELRLR